MTNPIVLTVHPLLRNMRCDDELCPTPPPSTKSGIRDWLTTRLGQPVVVELRNCNCKNWHYSRCFDFRVLRDGGPESRKADLENVAYNDNFG
jgi:hypothetical protein